MLSRLLLGISLSFLFTQCASPYDMPKEEIGREFIVQLREVGEVKDVTHDIKKLKLSVERSIVPTMNIWLLKSENTKWSNEKIIEKLKEHPMVVEAEVNKRLQNRRE